jgi:hypothetical protein
MKGEKGRKEGKKTCERERKKKKDKGVKKKRRKWCYSNIWISEYRITLIHCVHFKWKTTRDNEECRLLGCSAVWLL